MGWTAPRTWLPGEIVTADIMNEAVRENLKYLKGIGQVPTIESGLVIDNTDGDEYFKLPLLLTSECTTVLNAEGEVAFDETLHRMKFYDNNSVVSVVSTDDVDDTPVNGATTDPVSSNWAYDFINILTTAGDLPLATAAGVWTRLGIGASGTFLGSNGTVPSWTTSPLNTKLLSHTRDNEAVSGDVSYTTYGFQPKTLIILATFGGNRMSVGFGDVNLAEMCLSQESTTLSWQTDTNRIVSLTDNNEGTGQTAVLKTLDADGFTLTWTKIGGPAAGNLTMAVLALS